MGIRFHVILTALTDIADSKHYYGQQISLFNKGIITISDETKFARVASIRYSKNEKSSFGKMDLDMDNKDYSQRLHLEAKKATVWHCDDGVLLMGNTGDPKDRTFYFSITNLDLESTMELHGQVHEVKGKAWFDKQGGHLPSRKAGNQLGVVSNALFRRGRDNVVPVPQYRLSGWHLHQKRRPIPKIEQFFLQTT